MARSVMAMLASTFFVAIVLATHTESVPLPDAGNLVVTTTETQTSVSADTTSPSPVVVSTTSVLQESKPPPPKIYSMHINTDIEFRFAKTLVTSRVANPANQSQEVSFNVVLPQNAFITGFVMEIDGKSYRAYVKEKEEAKKTYEEAIQHGQAAAHVAYSARESNSFDVNVNIEPMKKVTFNLTYEELLTRSKGLYRHVVTISPGQVVPDMLVKVHIKEPRNITKLYTPKFSSENKVTDVDGDPCSSEDTGTSSSVCTSGNQIARKNVLSPNEAIVEFGPTLEEQKKLAHEKGKGLSGQFEVLYDVQRDPSGGEVLVRDGYFVHFFAPTDLQILPKHIVFVLDISGSMMGRKIDQVKDAMRTILASLQPDDYFNVIVFSSHVTSWDLDNQEADLQTDQDPHFPYFTSFLNQPSTTTPSPGQAPREAVPAYPASQKYIQKALVRINETGAGGGTNIFGGLKQAIKTIKGHRELLKKIGDLKARKSIVMFLTDGEANVGESDPTTIISKLSELNTQPQAPIYSLTFGEDGDIDFLTKLSLANSGLARVIYEGADADVQLKRFYLDISSPLLSDVTFKYLPNQVDQNSTTKTFYHTYYQGGELVVAGRTADKEIQEISADVSAAAKDSQSDNKTLTATQYPVKSLPYEEPQIHLIDYIIPPPREAIKERPTTSLERAWAYLTVKQLIEEYEAKEHKTPSEQRPSWLVTMGNPTTDSPTPSDSTSVAPTSTTPKPENTTEATNATVKPSAKQRALDLALKYSFVTKLTSLVVVKPNATQATEAKRIVQGENGASPLGVGGHHLTAFSGRPGAGFSNTLSAPPPRWHGSAGVYFRPPSTSLYSGFSGGMPIPVSQYLPFFPPPALSPRSGLPGIKTSSAAAAAAIGGTWGSGIPGWQTSSTPQHYRPAAPPAAPPPPPPPSNYFPAGIQTSSAAAVAAIGGTWGSGIPGWQTSSTPQHYRPAAPPAAPPPPPPPPPPPSNYFPAAAPASAFTHFSNNLSGIPKRKLHVNVVPESPVKVALVDRILYLSAETVDAHVVEDIITTIAPDLTETPTSNTTDYATTIAPGSEEPAVLNNLDKLNIADVKWLTPEALTNGSVELDVNGEKKIFNILSNADTPNATDCTAPGISSGKCRHLSQCVLRAVTSSVEAYLPFQCQLENYLAVCCVD